MCSGVFLTGSRKPIATARYSLAHQQTLLTFALRHDHKRAGLIRDVNVQVSDRVCAKMQHLFWEGGPSKLPSSFLGRTFFSSLLYFLSFSFRLVYFLVIAVLFCVFKIIL